MVEKWEWERELEKVYRRESQRKGFWKSGTLELESFLGKTLKL